MHDLRSFLQHLSRHRQLLEIDAPVDPVLESTTLSLRALREGGFTVPDDLGARIAAQLLRLPELHIEQAAFLTAPRCGGATGRCRGRWR